MKVNGKKFLNVMLHSILFSTMFIFMIITWNRTPNNLNWTSLLTFFSGVLLVLQLISFHSLGIKLTDFSCLFILLSYMFLLGRVFLHGLGQEKNYNLFFYRYSNAELFKTAVYCLCTIQALFLGFVFSYDVKMHQTEKVVLVKTDKFLYKTGLCMLVICFPFELYRNIVMLVVQSTTDSYIGENMVQVNGILTALGRLTVVGVLCMISSNNLSKSKATVLTFGYIAFEFLFSAFTGARSYAVIAALVLMICLFNMYQIKLKIGRVLLLAVLCYLAICFITAVASIRSGVGNSISTFMNAWIKKIFSGDLFYQVLLEFGNTQNTVGMGIKYFDGTNNFYKGTTIALSWLSAIPGVQRLFPDISLLYNPIDIMTKYMPGYYFGGSVALDTYINFGFWGVIASVCYGMVMSLMLRIRAKEGLSSVALYYAKFYILLRMVRCGISEVMRLMIYMLLIYLVINLIMKQLHKGRNRVLT